MRSPGRWLTLAQWISFGGSWGWSVTYWAATRSAPTFTDRRCSAVSDPALLLTAALAGDHPLTGPPPARVVDPVPHAGPGAGQRRGHPRPARRPGRRHPQRRADPRAHLDHAGHRGDEVEGVAADWALARLPPEHRPVLAHAQRLYLRSRYSEESWADELRARVRPHVDHVLAEIDRLSRR
jgi:hypothetical protein